jgi:energy-converting hydrogenase Eha subunit A
VWAIYAFDRLLDASLLGEGHAAMETRHRFQWRHRKWFRIALMVVVPLTLVLVVTRMPMALYKHLIPGGVLVAGFFGLAIITSQEPERVSLTKNLIGGTAFAFGTAIVAHVYRYEFGLYDMVFSREFVCFAMLCIVNISAIGLWEHAARAPDREVAASDELALTLPLILLGAAALAYAVMDSELSTRPFYYAILTAAGLLYVLNRSRSRFGLDALRVLADVAMLVPVLVFIAARR